MERILVLIDPSGPQRETMEFACHIANITQSTLTGLFYNPPKGTDAFHISEIKATFRRFCNNHQTLHKQETIEVHRLEDIYVQTRFADLLILTPDYGAKPDESILASENILNVLKLAECPIFVAPLNAKQPSEIVFTYDGSPSSVFAIKQFTQLFPEFSDLQVTLLEVQPEDASDVTNRKNISEYLDTHYRYVNQLVLKGQPEDELFSFLLDKKQMYIVMGAFGKHFMHSLLHRSTATLLLKTTALPVFISHK